MEKKKKKIVKPIAYLSFYLAVIVETVIVLIDKSSMVNSIEGRMFQLTFLLCFLKVILTKYTKREYLVIFIFGIVGVVSYLITGRNESIRIIFFIAACKDIDMKKCLKLVFYLTLSGCLVIMVLSAFGIGGAMTLTQDYGRGSVETRYVLGMGHPNALQCMVWALTVLGLYLYGEKIKWYGYLLILGVNVFFFYLTDSKTSLIAAVFAILYAGAYRFADNVSVSKICNFAGVMVTLGSVAISVFIAGTAYHVYNYDWGIDNSALALFLKKLDIALTGRIRSLTGNTRWEGTIQTWKLFSEPANNYYFDMGWIRLFYWYGIIPATIAVIILLVLLLYCMRKKKYMELVMIVSFAVYTVVEAHAISVYLARNYVLFLLGAMWTEMLIKDNWKGNL